MNVLRPVICSFILSMGAVSAVALPPVHYLGRIKSVTGLPKLGIEFKFNECDLSGVENPHRSHTVQVLATELPKWEVRVRKPGGGWGAVDFREIEHDLLDRYIKLTVIKNHDSMPTYIFRSDKSMHELRR
ncbi:hypothetical protein [Geothrix sp. 21YS21S-2]|uniref:hypothetical protein n=1 Tax=Geothrix sp. 21YS21S-2 TaxID=3068893 RepID=UPI0027BABEBF|nr:hypothetical protein [Geothrix sp. 21YS21S-2]